MSELKVKIKMPRHPNYLILDDPFINGRDGGEAKIDVASIPDDQLREIGSQWVEGLIKHAAERRYLARLEETPLKP